MDNTSVISIPFILFTIAISHIALCLKSVKIDLWHLLASTLRMVVTWIAAVKMLEVFDCLY